MVAHQILVLTVWVRVLVPQQYKKDEKMSINNLSLTKENKCGILGI